MIDINGLGLFLPDGYLFKDVGFQLVAGDKVGLTGKNGAGKSTMLKIISEEQAPSEGRVNKAKDLKIGYLTQDIHIEQSHLTVYDFVFQSNKEILDLEEKLEDCNNQLTTRTDYESDSYAELLNNVTDYNDRFNVIGGHEFPEKVSRVLQGLGFLNESIHQQLNSFSGGWQMRAVLAGILVNEPDILLLDEPTNHLDIISISWLENYLKSFTGCLLLISHDRRFLDNVTNRTLEINRGKVYDYRMNYSKYLIKREEEFEQQIIAKKQQDKEIKKTEELINKFRAKSSKASFAQSLMKKLDGIDKIEVDQREDMAFNIKFPLSKPSGRRVLELDSIEKKFGDKVVLNKLDQVLDRGEKIALIGANGTGKSTLVKVISKEENFSGKVEYGHNVDLGYFSQNEADLLDQEASVFDTIDRIAVGEVRNRIRAILGGFLFSGEAVEKKVKVLSGGEKNRLGLCRLIVSPSNLLILDEPTNHLDISSKEVLKEAIKRYEGTVIVVSHDREFLDGLVDKIWEIDNGVINEHYGSVDEFLKNKDFQMQELLSAGKKNKNVEKVVVVEEESAAVSQERTKELKKLKTRLNTCERDIEKLEQEKKESDKVLAELDYSNEDLSAKTLANHAEIEKKLASRMQDWEEITMKME
jgi:ATP-binding cassette, subfamily F, member 3